MFLGTKLIWIAGVTVALSAGAVPAAAAVYADDLKGATIAGFQLNVDPVHTDRYGVAPSADGVVFTRAAGSGNGGAELLSRFTFSGAFRLTVDVAGLASGLGANAESGIGVKAPGCCANSAFADIFGLGNAATGQNNHVGLTELSRRGIVNGDQLVLVGDTSGAAYHLNLFLDQEFGGTDANRVTFSNLSVTADRIAPGVPEPAAWSLMIAGFALTGAALRRRPAMRVAAA